MKTNFLKSRENNLPFLDTEEPLERIFAMDCAKDGFSATMRTVFIFVVLLLL